jgi:peroxiredoxin
MKSKKFAIWSNLQQLMVSWKNNICEFSAFLKAKKNLRVTMFVQLYLLTLLFAILTACSGIRQDGEVNITGTFTGAEGKPVVLQELTPEQILPRDSAIIDNAGNFGFPQQPLQSTFYLLRFDDNRFITFVMHPDDGISVSMDTASFPYHYEIEGNIDSRILQQYFTTAFTSEKKLDSLRQLFFDSRHLDDFRLIKADIDLKLEQLIDEHREFTKQLVEKHHGSFAGLLLLNRRFAGRLMLSPETDVELFDKVDSALMQKHPDNVHVLAHHHRMREHHETLAEQQRAEARLASGQHIPDITLRDQDNQPHSISSLIGNPAIIYFWVSYSPRCRAANHQLKELYSRFHPEGLEIFAISLDHQQRFWADAIKVDELPWINVSDLRGMSSPVVNIFNLPEELPYFILVDSEGRIVTSTEKFGEIKTAVENMFKAP